MSSFWVPWQTYVDSRVKILQGFTNREFIYQTEEGRTLWEKKARGNIESEISLLRKTRDREVLSHGSTGNIWTR